MDEQEQRESIGGDMELEYAFDMEEDMQAAEENGAGSSTPAGKGGMTGVPAAADMGVPESFVIGDAGTENNGETEKAPEGRAKKQSAGRKEKAADSISYRMFHWKFSVEQKEELKRAMAVRVPKEVILSYFYPETSVVRMMEIRSRYE